VEPGRIGGISEHVLGGPVDLDGSHDRRHLLRPRHQGRVAL
jgi:hypothetical protein